MTNTITSSIEGFDEADRALAGVEPFLRRKLADRAVRRAAGKTRSSIRKEAPKGDGIGGEEGFPELKKEIKAVVRKYDKLTLAVIGPTVEARQAHLVEFGHKMVVGGTISSGDPARTRKAKDPNRTGKGRVVGLVEPKPFVRPGAEKSKPQVERTMVDVLKQLASEYPEWQAL